MRGDDLVAVTVTLSRRDYETLREHAFQTGSTVTVDVEEQARRRAMYLRQPRVSSVLALHNKGLGVWQIAARLEVPNNVVRNQLSKLGLLPNLVPRPRPRPQPNPRARKAKQA